MIITPILRRKEVRTLNPSASTSNSTSSLYKKPQTVITEMSSLGPGLTPPSWDTSHFLSDLPLSLTPFPLHCQVLLATDPLSRVCTNTFRCPVSFGEPLPTWQPQTTSLAHSCPLPSGFSKALLTLTALTSTSLTYSSTYASLALVPTIRHRLALTQATDNLLIMKSNVWAAI